MTANQEGFFKEIDKSKYGENRQLRPLFLPRILNKEAITKLSVDDDAFKESFEIFQKWAKLSESGKLKSRNEISLQGEFLAEVFGKGPGYTLFSDNLDTWELEPQYSINGGTADGAIGHFSSSGIKNPVAVIELKRPSTNVDRDRSQGRTAVQQCWDYLNDLPECQWGIVCNYVSFRLYHRNQTSRSYQLFVLDDLQNEDNFRQFYYLFQRDGLLELAIGQPPRAEKLLKLSTQQKEKVGDDLYKSYDENRAKMILHLMKSPHSKNLDQAIRITQKLLDRIIVVAFCEDRDLLESNSLDKAHNQIPPFAWGIFLIF
ncbi:MAG: hypothetical protein V3V99_05525 [candidate division Zixibacteria bacterium]